MFKLLSVLLTLVFSFAQAAEYNQRVNFKKDFVYYEVTDSTAGAITALNTTGKNLISLTGSAPIVQGIDAGESGKIIQLLNNSGGSLSIANNSGSATAARRILTGTATSISIPADGSVTLIYDSFSSRWKVLSSGSPLITVPATAGHVYSTGTAFSTTAFGGANSVLGLSSTNTIPEYKSLSVGTTGTDFAIANGAGTITFNLPDASASARGVITTGGQNIAGGKTFTQAAQISATTNQLILGSTTTTTISAVAPASSRVVSIQDPGANADFVTTAGAQTLAGVKTHSSQIPITATTNQLVLGTTNTTTVSAVAPAASRTISIQDPGANADFVTTAGAQTLAGVKTHSSQIPITATTNQLVLGTTNTTTITAPAPAASRTYSITDAGAAANFVMSEGAQTINGKLTINSFAFPNRPVFFAQRTSNQSINNSTDVVVVFDSAPTNVGTFYNTANGKCTIASGFAGVYRFNAQVNIDSGTGNIIASIRKNGTTTMSISTLEIGSGMTGIQLLVPIAWTGSLAVSDFVEVVINQGSATAKNLRFTTNQIPFFTGEKID